MATYNGAKYIREQINSILSQTIQDYELVICDDCSTDETVSVLDYYANKDPRIIVVKNRENIGFKRNFEKAISLCIGDYIALSDQDDIWLPNHLEILLGMIGNNMIACGNAEMIDAEGKPIGFTLREMEILDKVPNNNIDNAYSLVFFRNPYQGSSMLIKRELFKIALPIPDEIGNHDVWFALLSCFYGGMIYKDIVVNRYRMHGNNVTGMRIKKKSRIKVLIYQILYTKGVYDRPIMIKTILERLTNLTLEQISFLNKANKIFKRSSSLRGRLLNTFFRIKHFKTIYNCN